MTSLPPYTNEELLAMQKLSIAELRAKGLKLLAVFPNEEFVREFYSTFLVQMGRALAWEDETEKHAVMSAVGDVLAEGFVPAFDDLEKIRAGVTPDTDERRRMKPYEDFTRTLWHAYKDLTWRVCKLAGQDFGFIWADQKRFEAGLLSFTETHHASINAWFPDFLKCQRGWQDEICYFRNHFLEHKKEMDSMRFAGNYEPGWAEVMFERAWNAAYYIISVVLLRKLPWYLCAVQMAIEERPEGVPRFRLAYVPGYHFAPVTKEIADEFEGA